MIDKNTTDHMARVEQAIEQYIHARTLVIIDGGFTSEREDYWERQFHVAWTNEEQSGTHRVHITSNGDAALFVGHYRMDEIEAKYDAFTRAGMYVGRI